MSGTSSAPIVAAELRPPVVVKLLGTRRWPKQVPFLTPELEQIAEDFMSHWQEILPQRFRSIELFNQRYPAAQRKHLPARIRTLEIGAGPGEHLEYEDLAGQDYYALELRSEFASIIKRRFPQVTVLNADCQRELPFPRGYFDRVLAIHVLEHLPELPQAVLELRRVLKRDGEACVVIPCEDGLLYRLARNVSTRRIFEKRYKLPYGWGIYREHINNPSEIMEELSRCFTVQSRRYFPFFVPIVNANLCIGLTLKPR